MRRAEELGEKEKVEKTWHIIFEGDIMRSVAEVLIQLPKKPEASAGSGHAVSEKLLRRGAASLETGLGGRDRCSILSTDIGIGGTCDDGDAAVRER